MLKIIRDILRTPKISGVTDGETSVPVIKNKFLIAEEIYYLQGSSIISGYVVSLGLEWEGLSNEVKNIRIKYEIRKELEKTYSPYCAYQFVEEFNMFRTYAEAHAELSRRVAVMAPTHTVMDKAFENQP